MKNNEFYHSHVDIVEYKFESIYLGEIDKNLIEKIKLFNLSNDTNYKRTLLKDIPISFPKCRFCGKEIVNSNFKIGINNKENSLKILCPSIYCREIDGKKYYLSCCEDCLLEHFKDNPPKSKKYYFMKANKYGQYCYGYSDIEYKKICSMTVGVTYESMINKWGNDLGEIKWKEYKEKQALTNSFEYKSIKYNWTKNDFDTFNKSRAITKENLIKKYGENDGIKYYDDYVNKQKITKSTEYMIEKYGEEKTKKINASKGLTIENFIKKYGEEEGLRRYEISINNHKNYFSKISQKFFSELDNIIAKKYTTYYATKNGEYGVMLNNKTYARLDYFILELNICIEFNGTYYHADPRFFNENDTPNPHIKTMTAKQIWENDNTRYKQLKETRNIDTIVVWENDYLNGIDINDFIKNKLKILY